MSYMTIPQTLLAKALLLSQRADRYRRRGHFECAAGCERKARKKLEQLRALAEFGMRPGDT